MFTVVKIVKPLFLPSALIAIGMAASIFLLWRGRVRWGRRLLVATFVVYYALATGIGAYALAWTLERQYADTPKEERRAAEAIVVLAGGAAEAEGRRFFAELTGASWRRLARGIAIATEEQGRLPLLYSGGSGDPFRPASSEAELAKRTAIAFGIRDDRVWIESQSRDTYESAVAIKKILDDRFLDSTAHTVVLVTSARHMPRAAAVFKRQGIAVLPSPADFAVGAWQWNPLVFLPSADAFASSSVSLHEWIGIAGYALTGRI